MRTPLSEIKFKDEKYNSIYRGVVEDNKDPEKRGRCKIRVFGIHDIKKEESNSEGIPTDKLPWADPVFGLFEGSISGFGAWSIPLQGSHVFVFFEGGNRQQIRFFATVPGVPTEAANVNEGFNDPDGIYPLSHRLNESDFHRLSRDEKEGTIVEHKEENLDKKVQKALNQGDWDEPDPFYNKTSEKYPNNNVFATHNGIIIEVDTSDEPRLHVFHPSNSYIEIDNEGNEIIRNEGVRYDIVIKDYNKHIKQDYNTTVDNNKTKKIGNDEYTEIGGNKEQEIGGNEIRRVTGDITIEIGSNKDVNISGDCNINVGGSCNINVGGNTNISAGGNCVVKAATITLN